MNLSSVQGLWLVAVALYVACLLLDVANVLNVPPIYMLLGSTLFLISGCWVMPSKEMQKAQRRRP